MSPIGTNTHWTLERLLFALGGTSTLLSVLLALAVSQYFLLLAVLVSLFQWQLVITGGCPASYVLTRMFGLNLCHRWGTQRQIARRLGGAA